MRRMQVEVKLEGAGATTSGVAALAQQLQNLGKTAGTTAVSLGTAGTGAAAQTAQAAAKIRIGPYQRLRKAQAEFQEAVLQGTTAQFQDAQMALGRAQAQVAKLAVPAPLARTQKLPALNISGPYTALAKAQSDLIAALQRGTAAQVKDAQVAVDRAQARLDALYQASLGKTIKLPAVKVPKPFSLAGPNQRLLQAQADLQKALQSGVASQINDAEIALRRAQEQLVRAQRPAPRQSRGGRVAQAILSTRFNVGGQNFGVSPLVGRTLTALGATGPQAAGIAGAALALAAVVAIASLAIRKFADAVKEGADALGQAANARTLSGGTTGNIAGLRSLGIPAGEIAGLASSLREARGSNPLAAAQFGFQLPRPFGGQNEAAGLEAGIETIANLKTAEERLRAARLGGLEGILPLIEAMRRSRDAYQADKKVRASVENPGATRAAADFSFALMRVKSNWEVFTEALATPLLKPLTAQLMTFADMLRELAKELGRHPELLRVAVAGLAGLGRMILQLVEIPLLLGEAFNPKQFPAGTTSKFEKWANETFSRHMADLNSAVSKNTQATQDATDATNGLAQLWKGGMYGGGPRAAGAIPAHLIPSAIGAGMNWKSIHMGVWGL